MLTRYQARLMARPQPSSSIPASTRTDQSHQSFQKTYTITTTIQTCTYPILSTVINGEAQSKSVSNHDTTTKNVSSGTDNAIPLIMTGGNLSMIHSKMA